ncbi:phosphomannomutase/phosphoglucomutase [Compostimonas suwonensis]|uniref:Phosphomannomutase n=1 Tax=Compostimonas suwonensis TaxID=1048394 RepID=A0A2M9BUT1_9MICO|nr:phosphomannomutase/phosphoglucomutase [Compostimonas suwonensis]PJJ61709.1 phosphomannomutase [Compostimonas suwonensis]
MNDGTGPEQANPLVAALRDSITGYDVRGLVGSQLSAPIVEALGAAFVDVVGAAGSEIVVGHDARDSSPEFAEAFSRGARARGADVVSIGLCSTDESCFASGTRGAPSAMITASHNPASYNGIKLSRPGAQSIGFDTGLADIRDRAEVYLVDGVPDAAAPGSWRELDVLADYAAALRGLVELAGIRPLTVVVDAGNGMAGLTVPAVLGTAAGLPPLPITIVPLFFERDGSFPNHDPDPLEPANLLELRRAVVEHDADLGIAFDGDADRCFLVDELGQPVTPSAIAALVAAREIARARLADPQAQVVVLHDLITSRAVPETVEAAGGIAVRTPVGHSVIVDLMRETGAVFGAEHSGHYFFRDFWSAENGMLAAMHVLAEHGGAQHPPEPFSALAQRYTPYAASGEVDSVVDDVPSAYSRIVEEFMGAAEFDELDGLTVTGTVAGDEPFWWFSVRPSNTEPLLRLTVEAETRSRMEQIRDRVLELIGPA